MAEDMNQVEYKELQVGDVITGKVTKVEDKQVFVSVENSKLDGIIPISELSSLHVEKASDVVTEGEELELSVTKVEEEALILSKKAVLASKAWDDLEQKFNTGEVFEAVVKDVVKGGLVVDLGVRGFRSEEHTSELQSRENLVCRLLLEKKKKSRSKWRITHS